MTLFYDVDDRVFLEKTVIKMTCRWKYQQSWSINLIALNESSEKPN